MVLEEWEIFDEILKDGAVVLADAFMANLVPQAPGTKNNDPQSKTSSLKKKFWCIRTKTRTTFSISSLLANS